MAAPKKKLSHEKTHQANCNKCGVKATWVMQVSYPKTKGAMVRLCGCPTE